MYSLKKLSYFLKKSWQPAVPKSLSYPPGAEDTIFLSEGMVLGERVYIGPFTQITGDVHLGDGVKIIGNCVIDGKNGPVIIGAGTVIEPHTLIVGPAVIGENSEIRAKCSFRKSDCGSGCKLVGEIEECIIGNNLRTRPGCVMFQSTIGNDCEIGAEVRKSHIGDNSKAVHQNSYLGNATVGDGTNFASGSITLNYDGTPNKKDTEIGPDCFIGAGNLLVAPLIIGKNVATAAGVTIRHHVSDDTFVDPEGKFRPNEMENDGDGHWRRIRKN